VTISRREFFGALAGSAATVAAISVPAAVMAQQDSTVGSSNVPMAMGNYIPVRLPPKSDVPSMTPAQRDVLEHKLHCMCGCNLDVYTCRTTDFSCPVSPRMHRDVMALVAGGYPAQDIINAFVHTYGQTVLMAPPEHGVFNLTGYFMPFVALSGGVALVIALIRRWHRPAGEGAAVHRLPVEGTPEELAKIEELIRSDEP
jgi:cytochrome c-type biogenesis protein CcmH